MNRLSIFFILFICFSAKGQHIKQWDIEIPSNIQEPTDFNFKDHIHFTTFQLNSKEFITITCRNLDQEYGYQIHVFKFDSNGIVIWEYFYDDPESLGEEIYDVELDKENNLIIAGESTMEFQQDPETSVIRRKSNFLLVKISENGSEEWRINQNNTNIDFAGGVTVDSVNNIYSLSPKLVNSRNQSMIQKFNSDGDFLFEELIDGKKAYQIECIKNELSIVTQGFGRPYSIYRYSQDGTRIDSFSIDNLYNRKAIFDNDGNLYVLAPTGTFQVDKYSSDGSKVWTYKKESNLPSNIFADEAIQAYVDYEKNVYLTGRYYGENYNTPAYTGCDILTVKLDSVGDLVWENLYMKDKSRSCEIAYNIAVHDSNTIYVVGKQSQTVDGDVLGAEDMLILEYNDNGIRTDSIVFNGESNSEDYGLNLITNQNALYLIGISQGNNKLFNNAIIKFSDSTSSIIENKDLTDVIISPNPVIDHFKIEILRDLKMKQVTVYNSNGAIILKSNSKDITNLNLINSGIYIVEIEFHNRAKKTYKKVFKL